jgi:hypothetical protein
MFAAAVALRPVLAVDGTDGDERAGDGDGDGDERAGAHR